MFSSSSPPSAFNPSESPNYGFTFPASPSRNMRALLAYIDAMNSWSFEAVMDCFDETLEHRILPKSLGRPVLTKKLYGEYFKGIMKILRNFKMTIHEVIEADGCMTVHATAKGESYYDAMYEGEMCLIIHFVPSPPNSPPFILPKMRLVKEFVDSNHSLSFFAAAGKVRHQRDPLSRNSSAGTSSSKGSNA